MSDAHAWARRLASGGRIAERVAVVVAHPDDETLWTGSLLHRLHSGTLVMVTDGAPQDMADAHRLGLASREDYAQRREGELDAALAALESGAALLRYAIPDQATVRHVAALADRLTADLAGTAVIVTHPYEGGHPDHDAVALAARLAADRLATPLVEFACYAQFDGTRVFARFVPDPEAHERLRPLEPEDNARIERALAAHVSQASVFGTWRPDAERWRAAPRHDFTRPPPGEAVLFDSFGWAMTGAAWRAATHAIARTTAWA